MEFDQKQNDFEASFVATLKDANLQNLAIDIGELSLDSLMKDGILRDIPIVGTVISLTRLGANIQDKLFLKKILSFLKALKDVPIEDRSKMICSLDDSKKYRVKVGEKLLYIIDNCSDFENSEKVACVFKYLLDGKITYDEFLKTAKCLENLSMSDFNWFIKERKSRYYDLGVIGDLISSGLFELYFEDISVSVEEEEPRISSLSHLKQKKEYNTDVDGGVSVSLSRSGEIILEIFCSSYVKPKTIKL